MAVSPSLSVTETSELQDLNALDPMVVILKARLCALAESFCGTVSSAYPTIRTVYSA